MDVERLRQSSQFRLLSLISQIAPVSVLKDLVIHEDLMKPLDQVAGARLLREHGVDKMFKLGPSPPQWKNSTRIFLIPAVHSVAENVALQIMRERKFEYHIIIVPKALSLIQSLFESMGVLDNTVLHSYSWDFIPLDSNLLSLELPQFFKASFVKSDNSLLGSVAKALMSFECLFGHIPCVVTLGDKSHKVHVLLDTWRSEVRPPYPSESEFSHLIMMDRSADFASLLLTQLTYEGVLDENFRIQSGFVYLDGNGTEGVQRLMVNSSKDEIYAEIKGKHISAVFQHLSGKAKELQNLRDKKNTESIEEMKQFVANDLKKIQSQQKSLAQHISACEVVMKKQAGLLEELLGFQHDIMSDSRTKEILTFIEDSAARQYDLNAVLRLTCLSSLMQGGIAEKDFKFLHKQLLQAYGYHHLSSLQDLQKLGLFCQRDSKLANLELLPDKLLMNRTASSANVTTFRKVCQRLNLLPVDGSTGSDAVKTGQHPSYVFGGVYTPLVFQLAEKCVKEKEPSLEEFARCFGHLLRTNTYNNPSWSSPSSQTGRILVCFLGGVTLAECAALDLLSRQLKRDIIVASTSTMSGPAFISSMTSQTCDT